MEKKRASRSRKVQKPKKGLTPQAGGGPLSVGSSVPTAEELVMTTPETTNVLADAPDIPQHPGWNMTDMELNAFLIKYRDFAVAELKWRKNLGDIR